MSTGASGRGVMVRQRQRVRAEGVAASSVRMLEPAINQSFLWSFYRRTTPNLPFRTVVIMPYPIMRD